MCVPIASSLGSICLLFSFILELFILIGQTGNTSFLRKLNFVVARNQPQNLTYTTALWNYCEGNYQGVISSCMKGKPAFNWAQTPGIAQALPSKANSWFVKSLFLGMFCLFFIGCGFSFILWLLSIPICCMKRRGYHFSLGTLSFINFLVMLAALILALVLVLSGDRQLHNADNNWTSKAGDSLWITIGAVGALLFATLFYGGGGCCAGRKKKQVDPVTKVESYPQDAKMQQQPGYVASKVYVPHNQQYQPDIKYAQQQLPQQQQTNTYYHVADPNFTKLPAEPYSDDKKTTYVTGQTIDPYTGKPIHENQQHTIYQQQHIQPSTDIKSPTTGVAQTHYSGQVPNTVDSSLQPNSTTATTYTTRNISNDAAGNKVVYVPTDQGPVPVDQNAVSNNLQTVDADGNPIAKP